MQPSAKLRAARFALPLLLLAACTDTVDVPQTSLRDPRAAVGLSWCRSEDGTTVTARTQSCADGRRAFDRVAIADARLRSALLLNANLDLPRFADLSAGTPGNTGIPLPGGPTRLAASGIPGVAIAALADDQWTRNADATPAATGIVAFDAVNARAISAVLETSSLPGEIATATGGGTRVWVSLPAESAVQRFDLTWSCVATDGSRPLDCNDEATWTAGPRIAVESPAALQLSANGRLFVARGDGLGVEVFETTADCDATPCPLGRLVTAPSCADGLDDDGDGRTDGDDPQCFGPNDNETGDIAVDDATSCINGIDDNGDGLVDSDDPNCAAAGDEAGDVWGPPRGFFARRDGLVPVPDGSGNCGDGIDNDDDGATDRRDPTCFRFVKDESGPLDTTACTDGLDNNRDGTIDADDPGCIAAIDADEGPGVALPSCANDLDDDSDGLTDELDENCANGSGDERAAPPLAPAAPSGTTACSDGLDNDGDGAADWPADGGCSSASDTTETRATACSDGVDNDNDGAADWPADDDCYGPNDTTEMRPRAALLGPITLTPDDRVLVVAEQLSRSLVFFDTLHLSRLEASPGDPNRRQLGLAYPAAGVVTAITAIHESESDADENTVRERFSVHASLSGSAGFSVYTHGRDLTRNTTYPLFSAVDSNDSTASISTLQCGTGSDAPGSPSGSFAICSATSAAAPVLWSEEDGRIALPERWRYAVSTDALDEDAFDTERDDARMPDTSAAGLTWRFTAAGELPWTARTDGHFVSDAATDRWVVLAGNDACALPDLCTAFEAGLCPTLDSHCTASPTTAQADLCGDPAFDLCKSCPALCSSSVSLCDAGVRAGDLLVLERIPSLDDRALLSECRSYLGRASTALPLPPDLRFEVTAVAPGRLAISPVEGGTPLPPATCFPHGFAFRILAGSGWVARLDDLSDRPTGLGSPTEATEVDGECVTRPAAQRQRTRFSPGERIRHLSGLGVVLPATQPQGTEIRFGLTAAAFSPQFAVGATTVALTYLPEQNLLFVTDAATATVQARYGLQVSGHSNFDPLDYALP